MNIYSIVCRGPLARSSIRFFTSCLGAVALAGAVASSARADVVYNEATSGDLSNNGLMPTMVSVHPGSNQVWGTTGRAAGVVDLDYFTVNIPTGYALSSLWELPGTTSGGNVSFLGVQWGPALTVSPSAPSAAPLLGWTHYGATSTAINLLPMISTGPGAMDFSAPLGEGNYSFWIQELSTGSFTYGFDLGISAVPEPSTYGMFGGALVLLLAIRRRFVKKASQV